MLFIIAACFAMTGVFLYFYETGQSEFEKARTENIEKIDELTQQLVSLTQQTATIADTDYQVIVSSAAEAGQIVADAQNNRLTGYYKLHPDEPQPVDIIREYLVDNNFNRQWGDMASELNGVPCVWQFDSVYDFTLSEIPVLWTCWAGDDLIAAVTGSYIVSLEKFDDIVIYEMAASEETRADEDTRPDEAKWGLEVGSD